MKIKFRFMFFSTHFDRNMQDSSYLCTRYRTKEQILWKRRDKKK